MSTVPRAKRPFQKGDVVVLTDAARRTFPALRPHRGKGEVQSVVAFGANQGSLFVVFPGHPALKVGADQVRLASDVPTAAEVRGFEDQTQSLKRVVNEVAGVKAPPSKGEHGLQARLIQAVIEALPTRPLLGLLFSVPNGGKALPTVSRELRAEGLLPGVPDLIYPVPAVALDSYCREGGLDLGGQRIFVGLCIEMKTATGSRSPEQRAWHAALATAGWRIVVPKSTEAAWTALLEYHDLPSPLSRDGLAKLRKEAAVLQAAIAAERAKRQMRQARSRAGISATTKAGKAIAAATSALSLFLFFTGVFSPVLALVQGLVPRAGTPVAAFAAGFFCVAGAAGAGGQLVFGQNAGGRVLPGLLRRGLDFRFGSDAAHPACGFPDVLRDGSFLFPGHCRGSLGPLYHGTVGLFKLRGRIVTFEGVLDKPIVPWYNVGTVQCV